MRLFRYIASAPARASGLAGIATTVALLSGSASAGPVYSNDFEGGSTAGFSAGTIQLVPNGSTHILGEFSQGASTTLTLTGLAAHTNVTLNFTLDVVGSMDGDGQNGGGPDNFVIGAPGVIFNQNFANYAGGNTQNYPTEPSAPTTGAAGTDTLGYSGFPDSGNGVQDSIYNFSLTFASSSSTLAITFSGDTSEPSSNEFYGIDNVVVSTDATGVPEPASLALFSAGIAGLGIVRRRKQNRSR
jgi:hypothetical protein